jgi:glycosyltransferase involved in cell wall biosynthesis
LKILVATSDVPFVEGGHRVIAKALIEALREAGHTAELLPTPQNRFGRQFAAYLATRLTDVELSGSGERIDRLISLRFPAYLLKHPDHVCWLNHRMREYYDLWPDWTRRLGWKGKIKESIRRTLIHRADRYFLTRNVRKLFAQSKNIQAGLVRWGNIPSEVLYPPPPLRNYRTESYGDFIFSPSRLTPLKRVPLLIEALAVSTKNARAVIAGEGEERQQIESLIRSHSMQERVTLIGHAGEEKLLELYSKCRAVYYAPKNEDFGLVTVEAFQSRKPVITALDSGGPTELVRHKTNGFVVDPSAEAIARAITALYEDSTLAEKLGSAGYESVQSITWPETVRRLLTA